MVRPAANRGRLTEGGQPYRRGGATARGLVGAGTRGDTLFACEYFEYGLGLFRGSG